MKKLKLFTALLLAVVLTASLLAGCGPTVSVPTETPGQNNTPTPGNTQNPGQPGTQDPVTTPAPELTYAPGTVLRMATGYNKPDTGLFFDAGTLEKYPDGLTLLDGKTYRAGDLKPTWAEVQNTLNITFENKFQGSGSAQKEFEYWKEQLDQVDVVSGTAALLSEHGVAGKLVNIAEYLDMMPNFKVYLEANPIVRMTITADTSTGAIYVSPYFDGVSDIERMPLMRTDWVEKLLNGEGQFTAAKSGKTAAPAYEPYMPTSGKVEVDVVKADGSGVEKVTKDYDAAGNIVANMNAKGSMTGVEAVNMLREYIDKAYNGYYGTNRADLFIGQNAAWDADELVALLRCVVSNAQTLNGTDTIQGLFSREDQNNQRRVDVFRFAGTLFGVRGLESRKDYLYVGNDGMLHDARQEEATYVALDRMNAMAKEGLISEAYLKTEEVKTAQYLENDLGFMHYDYNQTQTIYNQDGKTFQEGEKYMAVMVPVARWNDGTGEQFMRFTESWRSVKTDGWGISKAGVGDNQDKLYAALKLIDFAYSEEGQILMSYGPAAWRANTTFNFNGKEMPEISEGCREELWRLENGNYTNYARRYLGSTLSFLKSQAFEFQCTTDVGREGAGHISTAIGLGTIKHPELAVTENKWYTSVPTILPTTTVENETINGFTNLGSSMFGSSSKQKNVLVDIIVGGYQEEGMSDAASAAKTVTDTYSGAQYLQLQNDAWDRALEYYNTLK